MLLDAVPALCNPLPFLTLTTRINASKYFVAPSRRIYFLCCINVEDVENAIDMLRVTQRKEHYRFTSS